MSRATGDALFLAPSRQHAIVVRYGGGRLARLVAAAEQEGRDAALAEDRSLIAGNEGRSGASASAPAAEKRGRPLGSKNRPKTDAPAKALKSGKTRKYQWAAVSPADRLARVNAIRKGRGLAVKSAL